MITVYFVALQSKKKTLSKDTSGKISKVIATDTYRQEQSREHWEEQSQTRQEQTKFPCKREDEEDEKFDTMGVVKSINALSFIIFYHYILD